MDNHIMQWEKISKKEGHYSQKLQNPLKSQTYMNWQYFIKPHAVWDEEPRWWIIKNEVKELTLG